MFNIPMQSFSKRELIEGLCAPRFTQENGLDIKTVTIEKRLIGNVLWSIKETTVPDGTHRFISCDVLQAKDAQEFGKLWEHARSEIESDGLTYTSCPIEFLKRVSQPLSAFAASWRHKVFGRYCEEHGVSRDLLLQ